MKIEFKVNSEVIIREFIYENYEEIYKHEGSKNANKNSFKEYLEFMKK